MKILLSLLLLTLSVNSFCQEKIARFYFETNASDLRADQKRKFDLFIDTLNASEYSITDVQTFCDLRGTNEYNGELGERRMTYIKTLLASKSFEDIPSQSNGESFSGESTMPEDLKKWRKIEIHIEKKTKINESVIIQETEVTTVEPMFSAFDELTEEKINSTNSEPIILKIEFVPGTDVIYDEKSYYELDRLFQFMRRNESASVYIRGHVCCGSDLLLSMDRAYMVYNSLIQRGISPKRLNFKGFDNTLPLADEISEGNMQRNRRVDVIFSFPKTEDLEVE